MELIKTKTCPKCGRNLPFADFRHLKRDGTYHKSGVCNGCRRDAEMQIRAKKWEKANPGKTYTPRKFIRWTDERVQLLREFYPHKRTSELSERLGIPPKIIAYKAKTLGLHKTRAILSEIRANTKRNINL